MSIFVEPRINRAERLAGFAAAGAGAVPEFASEMVGLRDSAGVGCYILDAGECGGGEG